MAVSNKMNIQLLIAKFVVKVVWVIDLVLCFFTNVLHKKEEKQLLPKIGNNLLLVSATQLAKMIRERKVTSEEVLQAYIDRSREVNPIINAIVESRFKQALEEAKQADRKVMLWNSSLEELEERYPLLGIPISVKESIGVQGLSNCAGIISIRGNVAADDAPVIAQIKQVGGIIMYVTNTPELCLNLECLNFITGITNNPYDTTRTPGGSSGGEGAVLASACSVVGVGSDIGGSLRIPANLCGVFAHKPSPRSVDVSGHVPHSDKPMWRDVFIFGPMTRYAEDLGLMMKVMRDPHGAPLKLDEEVDMKDIKLYWLPEYPDATNLSSAPSEDVKYALKKTVDHFRNTLKLQVKEADLYHLQHSLRISWLYVLKEDFEFFSLYGYPTGWGSIILELLKNILRISNIFYIINLYNLTKKLTDLLPASAFNKSERERLQSKQELMDMLGADGVLICPSSPGTAPPHHRSLSEALNITYVSAFSVLGFPVTSVPVGLTAESLPVALQVVTRPGNDHLSLAVAMEVERALGGWMPPPMH